MSLEGVPSLGFGYIYLSNADVPKSFDSNLTETKCKTEVENLGTDTYLVRLNHMTHVCARFS